jgi:multidrug resistance efflux pump
MTPKTDASLSAHVRSIGPAMPADENDAQVNRLRGAPILITLIALLLASLGALAAWQAYVVTPWTRDGTVRAYVVTITPEVSGRVVQLPVIDNQFVRKGDLLLAIDPTDYAIAVDQAQAAVNLANADAENAQREAERRADLTTLEASEEEKQTYRTRALAAKATLREGIATLGRARVDLERTTIRSPVNGYVTNLEVQPGDFATARESAISVVNDDSYWVDGYFEETSLGAIQIGDPATVKLMGYGPLLHGHVASIARGITVANGTHGQLGLANVNPIFTWVRLAQRIPVRIELSHLPNNVRLVAGQTATVQIVPSKDSR